MPSARRMGAETARTRAQLVKVAAQVVRDKGCASLTAASLAAKVGLKRQIVHYYFGTIEDLLAEVARLECDRFESLLASALKSDEPVRATLDLATSATAMTCEFAALALRSKPFRDVIQRDVEKLRKLETQALARHLELRGIKSQLPPVVAIFVLQSVAQSMAVEAAIGISAGHAETRAFVEDWLNAFAEGRPQPRTSGPRKQIRAPMRRNKKAVARVKSCDARGSSPC